MIFYENLFVGYFIALVYSGGHSVFLWEETVQFQSSSILHVSFPLTESVLRGFIFYVVSQIFDQINQTWLGGFFKVIFCHKLWW